MYTQVNETKDCYNNTLIRGDNVEIIDHPFLRENQIGVKGTITDIQKYEDHFSSVDSRGEDEGMVFTDVIFEIDKDYELRLKGEFLKKIN